MPTPISGGDRMSRLTQLAAQAGAPPPQVEQPAAASTPAGAATVSDITFDDRVFFDFDAATPRPDAGWVLDAIAGAIKQDAPGTALTVLGHTDAIGTPAYNIDLSGRRAAAVLAALVERGVDPRQLSAVAIGEAQPVASNDTADGRARNRRVEFMLSDSMAANLAVVQDRAVPSAFFAPAMPQAAQTVQVLQPAAQTAMRQMIDPATLLQPTTALQLQPPYAADAVAPNRRSAVAPTKPATRSPVTLRQAEPVERRPLSPDATPY